jgi:hypothetical protein
MFQNTGRLLTMAAVPRVNTPMAQGSATPLLRMMVGIQKLITYWPSTRQKYTAPSSQIFGLSKTVTQRVIGLALGLAVQRRLHAAFLQAYRVFRLCDCCAAERK